MKAFEHINTEPVYIDEPVLYLLQPLSSNYYHAVIEATVRLVVRVRHDVIMSDGTIQCMDLNIVLFANNTVTSFSILIIDEMYFLLHLSHDICFGVCDHSIDTYFAFRNKYFSKQ